jgi:hypothetical protein
LFAYHSRSFLIFHQFQIPNLIFSGGANSLGLLTVEVSTSHSVTLTHTTLYRTLPDDGSGGRRQ